MKCGFFVFLHSYVAFNAESFVVGCVTTSDCGDDEAAAVQS